jgi:hypothetical protein
MMSSTVSRPSLHVVSPCLMHARRGAGFSGHPALEMPIISGSRLALHCSGQLRVASGPALSCCDPTDLLPTCLVSI